jgi:hypothetical protein
VALSIPISPSDRSGLFLARSSYRRTRTFGILDQFDLATSGVTALKVNYNSDDPFPASTHLDTLRYLIERLKGSGSG